MRYLAIRTPSRIKLHKKIDDTKVYELSPSIEAAQQDMNALLERGCTLPEAFIADNDLIALGAIRALQQRGLRIPEDIAVIGFDNIPLAEYAQPPLSSVEVPCENLGKSAVETLRWRIRNPKATPRNVATGTELIVRESVPQQADPLTENS